MLLELYAEHEPRLVPQLFTPGAVIRYPRSQILIGGVEAIERWYTAAFTVAPALRLDKVYADGESVWTRLRMSSGATRSRRPTRAQVARLTLGHGHITRMDVYPFEDDRPSRAEMSTRSVLLDRGRSRYQLRPLLVAFGVVAIIGSVMAAFAPASDPSTGVNATVGFGLVNGVVLAGGVIVVLLGARQWSAAESPGAGAEEPCDPAPRGFRAASKRRHRP